MAFPNRPRRIGPARPGRRLVPAALLLGLGAVALAALGCANGEFRFGDPFDRQFTFSEAQHRYTVLVRWAEFEKAKQFVDEDLRDAYMLRVKSLEEARFTEYESESAKLDDAKQSATVRVVYKVYYPSSPYESEITEIQTWTRDGLRNVWRVQSEFEGLPDVAAN